MYSFIMSFFVVVPEYLYMAIHLILLNVISFLFLLYGTVRIIFLFFKVVCVFKFYFSLNFT